VRCHTALEYQPPLGLLYRWDSSLYRWEMLNMGAWLRGPLGRRIWRDAAIVVAVVICLARASGILWPTASDFYAYYHADLTDLYAGSAITEFGAYLYSPLFAQVIEPLRWLPFGIALAIWTAIELGSLIYIAGPWSLLLFLPLAPEWMNGNVHLLMAAAVYAGLRRDWPWVWAVPAFTKLAPAIGLGWYAFRREWATVLRALAIIGALGVVSFLLAPDQWLAWSQLLLANLGSQSSLPGTIPIPLLIRLPLAVALLAWGARTDRAWTVPLACGLVMPSFWISALFAFGIAAARLAAAPSTRRPVARGDAALQEPITAPS
jgi:hypothetical protein